MNKKNDYFSAPDTVINWWDPENSHASHIYARELDLIQRMLASDETIHAKSALELSSGRGRLARRIASSFRHYTCSDLSPDMLSVLQQQGLNAVPMNAEDLTFPAQSYDYVFSLQAMVHYHDVSRVIEGTTRVLKPQGKFIFSIDRDFSLRRIIKDGVNSILELTTPFKRLGQDVFTPLSEAYVESLFASDYRVIDKQRFGLNYPIRLQLPSGQQPHVLSPSLSRVMDPLARKLEQVPGLNSLSTFTLYHVQKKV